MSGASGSVTLEQATTESLGKIKEQAAAAGVPLELLTESAKELKHIRMKGMVHKYNAKDPFGPIMKRMIEVRKRRERWSDAEFRLKFATKEGCAFIQRYALGVKWIPKGTDWRELPQGHTWVPHDQDLLDMISMEIFAVTNPETGLGGITGDSPADEYNLRKCIVYDLLEFRGDLAKLDEAWAKGEKEQSEPASPTMSGAGGSEETVLGHTRTAGGKTMFASGVSAEEGKLPYTRPKLTNGDPINTVSTGAIGVKKRRC